MTEELSTVYNVKLNDIILYAPKSEFESCAAGYYETSNNTLHLNVSLLFNENWRMTAESFLIIFHELKHTRQWAAINGWEEYGYSPEILYSWALNWKNENYVSMLENDEWYRKQPIEFDSFAFSNQLRSIFILQNS